MRCQIGEQTRKWRLVTNQLKRRTGTEQRLENPPGQQLGHGIRDPDRDRRPPDRASPPQDTRELETAGENLLGIGVCDTPKLGRHETSPLLLEQSALQLSLKQLQLSADGLRREIERARSGRYAALTHDRPEVQQMGVVEMFHISIFSNY